MSHVVLARKYRPRSFDQMVGQAHVVQALSNALTSGRLHHAYLFTGTRGIGKTTVSRILAKSLNCSGPDGSGGITAHPCGVCQACTEIDADRYIDYIELDAASNRSIDEIRDLIERAAYKPSVGRFKVFMIDEAHQLTKDAFNAGRTTRLPQVCAGHHRPRENAADGAEPLSAVQFAADGP
jgi:DNA polymerase-3 subunit gamma/tau